MKNTLEQLYNEFRSLAPHTDSESPTGLLIESVSGMYDAAFADVAHSASEHANSVWSAEQELMFVGTLASANNLIRSILNG